VKKRNEIISYEMKIGNGESESWPRRRISGEKRIISRRKKALGGALK